MSARMSGQNENISVISHGTSLSSDVNRDIKLCGNMLHITEYHYFPTMSYPSFLFEQCCIVGY